MKFDSFWILDRTDCNAWTEVLSVWTPESLEWYQIFFLLFHWRTNHHHWAVSVCVGVAVCDVTVWSSSGVSRIKHCCKKLQTMSEKATQCTRLKISSEVCIWMNVSCWLLMAAWIKWPEGEGRYIVRMYYFMNQCRLFYCFNFILKLYIFNDVSELEGTLWFSLSRHFMLIWPNVTRCCAPRLMTSDNWNQSLWTLVSV